jgi:endonuclease/exonuclease/phosphatase family metal-dependent hydrolase
MVKAQMEAAAAEVDNIIFAGDINLHAARGADKKYGWRCLLLAHDNVMAEANMRYLTTGVTYWSHGRHDREEGEARAHESVLDHIYVAKDLEARWPSSATRRQTTTLWWHRSRSTRSPPP